MEKKKDKFNPLVSIIIPVYNGENYLREAIDSALNQTYKNIEVIVVNDGSSDKTDEICKSYGSKIRYFKKENGGVSTALNLGIEKMKGEYFSWLSHDDLYYDDKIKVEVDYLRKLDDKNAVIYCDYEIVNENGVFQYNVVMPHFDLLQKPYRSLFLGCLNGITMLIPKNSFLECGYFDSQYRCVQDYDMWMRMIKKYHFYHLDKIITKTRVHSQQDSNTSPSTMIEGNKLWEKILFESDNNLIVSSFDSEIRFYSEMYNFLKNTPYDLATTKCKKKLIELELEYEEKHPDPEVLIYVKNGVNLHKLFKNLEKQTYENFKIVLEKSNENLEQKFNTKFKVCFANDIIEYIKEDTCKFVCVISSNVELNPNKLRKQVEVFKKDKKVMMCFTNYFNAKYNINVCINENSSSYLKIKRINFNTIMLNKKIITEHNGLSEISSNWLPDKIHLLNEYNCVYIKDCLLKEQRELFDDCYLKCVDDYYTLIKQILNFDNCKNYYNDLEDIILDMQNLLNKERTGYNPYAELERVYNSRSWKITKPFRKVALWMRKWREL